MSTEPIPPPGDVDSAAADVRRHRDAWAGTSAADRAALLRRCMEASLAAAEGQVRAACRAKGLDADGAEAAEEWTAGPMCAIRNMRLLAATLDEIAAQGRPRVPPSAIRRAPTGQLTVDVFPADGLDRLLYRGFHATTWMAPGVGADDLPDTIAVAYRRDAAPVRVAAVLGAGNVASIGPMDVLYKLFVENQVCVLKLHPVNDYLGPSFERGLAPLIEHGVLRLVRGGADVGRALIEHPFVDTVHITGSNAVHDRIVWGEPGGEQERNRRAGTPKLTKTVTSELGCVTPIIVVPGTWSERALDFHAANVATMVVNNASFNCNAAKLLVTSRKWRQRSTFLRRIEDVLARLPPRRAYYPTAASNYLEFTRAHPEAKTIGTPADDALGWTTIFDVDPGAKDDIVFRREAWCGVIAETALPGGDAPDYLARAVDFCNEQVWGTLSASVLIDPKTERAIGGALDEAVVALRYGNVVINQWAAVAYALATPTWGAYPGHTLDHIVSGRGIVHNTGMFDRAERSVVRTPFVIWPPPVWFATHRSAHRVARRVVDIEARRSWTRVPGIVWHALHA